MCGRYTLLADELEIRHRFNVPEPITIYEPSYNIAPGQNVLAVIYDGKKRRAGYLRWGLIPSWVKDEKIGYNMINARIETADVKPSFKQLMVRKQCLIIADSFYEWQQTDEEKIPQRIQVGHQKLFAFAGLWDKWQNGNEAIFTCTLLTKDSNDKMQDIHHRMPIILPKEAESKWIEEPFTSPAAAKEFIQSLPDEPMTWYAVSNYVNHAKNNDQACIEPLSL